MSNFLTVGSTRIRKSNIKEWGIYRRTDAIPVEHSSGSMWWRWPLAIISMSGEPLDPNYVDKEVRFLRVRTFQNETFDFDEDKFDIQSAARELEQTSGERSEGRTRRRS